jgi:hypothetical protein
VMLFRVLRMVWSALRQWGMSMMLFARSYAVVCCRLGFRV